MMRHFSQNKIERLERKRIDVKNERVKSVQFQPESFERPEDRCLFVFFCDKPASSACLHSASTYDMDRKVSKCALELADTPLLSPGDRTALELKVC